MRAPEVERPYRSSRIHPNNTSAALETRHFIDLARGMGIPANDAARQVMDIINDRGRI